MKRNNRLLISALIVLNLLFLVLSSCQGQSSNEIFRHLTLTWTNDPHTTQTVTWKTDPSIGNSFLQYTDVRGTKTIRAKREDFVTDLGLVSLHTVTLTNLKPGLTYLYRVGNGQEWSPYHTFATEPKRVDSFQFLVFGDSQSGDPRKPEYRQWMLTCQKAFQQNPQAKFFINLGDLVEEGQNYDHWNAWFEAAKGVIDTIPIVPVLGNHETYVPNSEINSKPIFWLAQFKVPLNGPRNLLGQAYSFNYGDVHFSILDSQGKEQQGLGVNVLQIQQKWLEQDLSTSKQKWKVVIFHKPFYSVTATRNNPEVKNAFLPILDKYQVDLVLHGHDHGLARTYPIYQDKLVKGGNPGTIYYITGRSGHKITRNLFPKDWHAFFYNPLDQPNYLMITVQKDSLVIKAFKQDGTLLDDFLIFK